MIVALATALLSPLAAAQQQADAQAAARARALDDLTGSLAWVLELPADLKIETTLRGSLESMASEHKVRMKAVLEKWVTERAGQLAPGPDYAAELRARALTMLLNEIVLWRLESPGGAYDEALAPVFARSRHCHERDGKSYFAQVALLLNDVAPEHRQVVLDGERALFARWGAVRTTLPERPVPSLLEREDAVIVALRNGAESTGPALPPILAHRLLAESEPAGDLGADRACALHAWGLRQALATPGLTRSEALNAYRFAMEAPVAEWMPLSPGARERAKSAAPDAYPAVAAAYDVQGSVTLRVVLDAEGRFKRASVIRRDIRVAGIPGRPVAFETLLDDASIARAKLVKYPKPDASRLKDGTAIAEQTIGWKLE